MAQIIEGGGSAKLGDIFLNKNIHINNLSVTPVKFTTDIIQFLTDKDFMGYNLFPVQKKIIETFYYTKDENGINKYNVLVTIAGMRSSKSVMAALMASFELHYWLSLEDPWGFYADKNISLMRGDMVSIVNIATSKTQGEQTVFSKLDGMLKTNRWWIKYIEWLKKIEREDSTLGIGNLVNHAGDKWVFKKSGIQVISEQSNSQSLVGKTSLMVLLDEIARADVSDSEELSKTEKRSAQAIFNALNKSTFTFKKLGRTVVVSAPLFEDDFSIKLLSNCGTVLFGKDREIMEAILKKQKSPKLDSYLGAHYSTPEMNPTITEEDLADEKKRSLISYNRDFRALPPSGISTFFSNPVVLDRSFNNNLDDQVKFNDIEIEHSLTHDDGHVETRLYVGKEILSVIPNRQWNYYLCADGGEKKDSFTLCLAHGEPTVVELRAKDGTMKPVNKLKSVYDFVVEWKPNKEKGLMVLFDNVEQIMLQLAKLFHIKLATLDSWNSVSTLQSLFSLGVPSQKLGITYNIYMTWKDRISQGLCEFPLTENFKHTIDDEAKKLVEIAGKNVDHTSTSTKDMCDSMARANFLIVQEEMDAFLDELIQPVKREDYKKGHEFIRDRHKQLESQLKKEESIWTGGNMGGQSFNQDSIWGHSSNNHSTMFNLTAMGKKKKF